MSEKLPYIHFYPGDWLKDIAVQSLDFEMKGIWFEMLLLMFESEPRGYLTLNEKPMTVEILAKFLKKTPKKTKKIVQILLERGVAKKEKNGCIFNSRMVRDVEKRLKYKENGAKGGLAKAENNSSKFLPNDLANDKQNPSLIVNGIVIEDTQGAPKEKEEPPEEKVSKEFSKKAIDLIKFWKREFQKKNGYEPSLVGREKERSGDWGRIIELLVPLFAQHSEDDLRLMLIKFLEDPEKKLVIEKWPIKFFPYRITKYKGLIQDFKVPKEKRRFI